MGVKTIAIEETGVNSKYKKKWKFIAERQVWVRVSEWEMTKEKSRVGVLLL